jgi:hypothetical protein
LVFTDRFDYPFIYVVIYERSFMTAFLSWQSAMKPQTSSLVNLRMGCIRIPGGKQQNAFHLGYRRHEAKCSQLQVQLR